jgi:hypothetical protein
MDDNHHDQRAKAIGAMISIALVVMIITVLVMTFIALTRV